MEVTQMEEESLQPGEELEIEIAECLQPLAESTARFLGIYGGRGGTKSWFAADLILAKMVGNPDLSVACLREVQGSLDQSCKRLLEIRIHDHKLEDYFEITSTQIRSRKDRGCGVVFFKGLSKLTADGIKSMESIGLAWLEEAQSISQHSIDTLLPTIRASGSQILATWNPIDEEVPIDKLLRGPDRVTNSCVIETNYWDNPFLSAELSEQIEHCKLHDPEKYAWIWCGKYLKFSEARVFKNWKIQDFETPRDAVLRFGLDWGFWPDPIVALRGYIEGRKIFIDYEAHQFKCLPSATPSLLLTIPQSETYEIRCANDRPERVADLRAAGFNAVGVRREPNSEQEGVDFLADYQIIVHPRCPRTAEELRLFSRKIDPLTGKVLPVFEGKNDHCISALRCMVDEVRRLSRIKLVKPSEDDGGLVHHWAGGRR